MHNGFNHVADLTLCDIKNHHLNSVEAFIEAIKASCPRCNSSDSTMMICHRSIAKSSRLPVLIAETHQTQLIAGRSNHVTWSSPPDYCNCQLPKNWKHKIVKSEDDVHRNFKIKTCSITWAHTPPITKLQLLESCNCRTSGQPWPDSETGSKKMHLIKTPFLHTQLETMQLGSSSATFVWGNLNQKICGHELWRLPHHHPPPAWNVSLACADYMTMSFL